MTSVRAFVGKIGRRLAAVDKRSPQRAGNGGGPKAGGTKRPGQARVGGPGRPKRAIATKRAPSAGKSQLAEKSTYPALPGDRLLVSPVFILGSVRSGSTMLRVMLNAHSEIHAPHELHLVSVRVDVRGGFARHAMAELGMDEPQLEHLLWDRLMHREMVRHGKKIVVNKTPTSVFQWRRLVECWPDARFIYLLRHPAATAASWTKAHPDWSPQRIERDVLRYMVAIEQARAERDGLTVRYEDITTDPEQEVKRLSEFIGVAPEPAMIEYGQAEHGSLGRGIGDWSERIRSGRVQPASHIPTAEEIPESLREISRTWGYLRDEPSDPGLAGGSLESAS